MPLYDYSCPEHGTFSRMRPMCEAGLPSPCPRCGIDAQRRIGAPNLSVLSGAQRRAHERNERSAHEPQTARRGCGHHRGPGESCRSASEPALRGPVRPTRPWMLGH